MSLIQRADLRRGYTIAYTVPDTNTVLHGPIIHIGLGLSVRNAIWIRCTDGPNKGKVKCILLERVIGVISYV